MDYRSIQSTPKTPPPHPIHLVADMGGTVAAVSHTGEILWDANLSGTLPHTPTIGDVDGDGQVTFSAMDLTDLLCLFSFSCAFVITVFIISHTTWIGLLIHSYARNTVGGYRYCCRVS
jgi:hypothetical protein